ncbi:uncharacterized protein LOC135831237 isoform X2 [Planococcus citri]|uniref:uncharacterized protein LOC135831237 isoform X2 n=1 Tax=Planococcus citri TaxID=170843 RepID=UPI0031F98146
MSIKSESMDLTTETKHYNGPAESADMEVEDSIQSDWNEAVDSFDKMELKPELLHGMYACGFQKPSAFQQRAIIPCIKGHDVIAQIQSGMERKATFLISILQRIDHTKKEIQALILTPTRKLAKLTQKILMGLSKFMENCKCHVSIRGRSIMQYVKVRLAAGRGPQVVVGTPVRVYNIIAGNKSLSRKTNKNYARGTWCSF